MTQAKLERNREVVHDIRVKRMTAAEVADKHSISTARVYQIIRDFAQHDVPEDVHMGLHTLGLELVKDVATEIMLKPPKPMFDVKGNVLRHPDTGEVIEDDSDRMKAMTEYRRADEEIRKLYARNLPVKQEIVFTEQRADAQRAIEAWQALAMEHPEALREIAIKAQAERAALPGTAG